MASIKQIRDGEVYYSCNCGWLDEKHLNMCSQSLAGTPKGLWHQLVLELCANTGTPDNTHLCANSQVFNHRQSLGMPCNQGGDGFIVQYQQNSIPMGISAGIHGAYLVEYGLTEEQKRQVALAICIDVWYPFEDLQYKFAQGKNPKNWFRWITENRNDFGSGFGQEDLISNLIGFYIATNVVTIEKAKDLCKIITDESKNLKILKSRGGFFEQNKEFNPIFDNAEEFGCESPEFPEIFSSVIPDSNHMFHKKSDHLSSDFFLGNPHGWLW